MTFDKVGPLIRRHEGNFREFPSNFNHHRPNPAFEPPWIGRQRWMATTPSAIGRGPGERWNRTNKLHVTNIPPQVPWDEIKRLFSTFGNVLQCEKGVGKTEDSCSAIVTYETQDQAQQAYTQLNAYELENYLLKVEYMMDRGPGSRSPRGGGRGNMRNMPFSGNAGSPLRASDFPLRILVLSDMVGAIIGRAGGTIRQITQQSRARVDVHRKENSGAFDKDEMYSVQVITIYGNPENCSLACQKILEVMQQEANNTNRGEVPLKILAHNNLIGRIIGKNGNTIKRIMESTDTKITVSSSIHDVNSFNFERIITIKGKLENICKAEQMISSKLRQSYENDLAAMAPSAMMFPGLHPMAMMSTIGNSGFPPGRGGPAPPPPPPPYGMYGNPPPYQMPMMYSPNAGGGAPPQNMEPLKETVYLYIPNSAVGAIIGTGGSTIRDMISSSGASIKVAQTNKDEPIDRQAERKVTIIGLPESQWKAQYMIFKKVSFEAYTSPQESRLKVEICVPSNQVGRIIGKGGQTVRELQRQTHAVIKLPEENDSSDSEETPVHIIGDFYSTQAAQRQIRALVNKSQMAGLRRPGGLPPNQRPVQAN
ncbi:insulin-like growth factor 2 mRNA-binding protein 1 isoform X1 [Uloborus diversus]|uniref:insulin-like growth factor 2 mRNA-binding protein 1 isoform X1 n=1 Tax=Uloborus diversus TaxID=327109 RepID=UPI00240950B6|nr:insulin-like growth factor 2 mRNA-binding protein 1 isoform X1 [Uloborus diversus]